MTGYARACSFIYNSRSSSSSRKISRLSKCVCVRARENKNSKRELSFDGRTSINIIFFSSLALSRAPSVSRFVFTLNGWICLLTFNFLRNKSVVCFLSCLVDGLEWRLLLFELMMDSFYLRYCFTVNLESNNSREIFTEPRPCLMGNLIFFPLLFYDDYFC
jgi:hypothetical protein